MIDPKDIAVVVQTIPSRKGALQDTLDSIQGSDLGGYTLEVVTQRPGETKRDNLINALLAVRKSGKKWGLRFEDDVLVNRHILHNLTTWKAAEESDFGAGWLWHSELLGLRRDQLLESPGGFAFRSTPYTVGSLGVLIATEHIPEMIIRMHSNWLHPKVDQAQDKVMSASLWDMGLRVYLHEPPLVEHNVEHVSTQAPDREVVPELHTAGIGFDIDWRRRETGTGLGGLGVTYVF